VRNDSVTCPFALYPDVLPQSSTPPTQRRAHPLRKLHEAVQTTFPDASSAAAPCNSAPETGLCRGAIPRWFWSEASGRCQQFTFGGCGGNANNFETEAACEAACAPGPPLQVQVLPSAPASTEKAAPLSNGADGGWSGAQGLLTCSIAAAVLLLQA
jgi:hypothetical protein